MDKVLVLGALEELGFEITTSLLEEGYEVQGIHLKIGDKTPYNDRRMKIGRNANFEEMGLNEWLELDDTDTASMILFVNGFDENVKRVWMEENSKFSKRLQKEHQYSVVFIYPFSEWEMRSTIQNTGNAKSFFVHKSNVRTEFQSIFKAILEVVEWQ